MCQSPVAPPRPGNAPDVVLASYRDGQVYLRFVLPFYAEAAPAGGQSKLASVAEPFAVQSIQARTAGGEEVTPWGTASSAGRTTGSAWTTPS